jgi:hypothetical protein
MQFLHINETAAWCREHGAEVADDWRLLADPNLGASARLLFAPNGSLGLEPRVASTCLAALGSWDRCLLWVTEWGVWPSSENWPAFYGARGTRGELGSLHYKPGHLFETDETDDLLLFLSIVLENGWDAHVLPGCAEKLLCRIWISHDGWAELNTVEPRSFELATV